MTPIADMVKRMLIANEPAAAIVAAIRAVEGVTVVTRDVTASSRDASRLRSKKYRDNKKLQALAAEAQANDGANRHAIVTRDDVTPPCDLLSIKEEGLSSEAKKVRKKVGSENARATRMQPGALLTEPFREAAIELGAEAERISGTWAEFVDYWIGVPGSRGTKLDWLATWRNRVRDVIGKGGRNGFNGTGANRTAATAGNGQSGSAAITAGVAAAAERRGRERAAARPNGPAPRDADATSEPDFGFGGTGHR